MNAAWRNMSLGCTAFLTAATFLLYGNILHTAVALISLAALAFLGLIALILLLSPERGRFSSLGLWAMPAIAGVVSYGTGSAYLSARLEHAQAALQPVVEAVIREHETTGQFPQRVDHLIPLDKLPWFVRGEVFYVSQGSSCDFGFSYKGAFIDVYFYNFARRAWERD